MTCRPHVVLTVALLCLIVACDQDPFRQSKRTVLEGYSLERFEDGETYYLVHSRDPDDGGGVIGGTVVRIGWDHRHIVVMRKATFGGDQDGWLIIDTTSGVIQGPMSDAEFRKNSNAQVKTVSAPEAWKLLDR